MATQTANYGLIQPEGSSDHIDINVINQNMEKIDAAIYAAYLKAFNTPVFNINTGDNLDDYVDAGVYKAKNASTAASLINCPVSDGFRLEVRYISDATRRIQTIYPNAATGYFYMRNYTATGWGNWYRYGGEIVSAVNTAAVVTE